MLEELAPFTQDGIMQLRIARQEVCRRQVDDLRSSDNDSTMELAETTSKTTSTTSTIRNKV